MIVHVVLFEPRADLTPADRVKLLDDLKGAASAVAAVRRMRVGRRIQHGLPGYEAAMQGDYQYALIIEFDDRAGLDAYLRHPAHEPLAHQFTASAARALAYDFDMHDAADVDVNDIV